MLTNGALLQDGRYRIIETLGRGGFGVNYLAEQVMAKRKVCIKEFFPKDYYKRNSDTGALTLSSTGFAEAMNSCRDKFVKEAQTIAAVDHPNIIPIYDVFEENNTAYYVMEYIEGESLSVTVKRMGALPESRAVAYIQQIAKALEHIHAHNIMHLDIKPGNIMVRAKDDRAILIDFGLSKHYDATSGEATSTTITGMSHGYAPVEQYQQGGVKNFSPETDIYSLGATLFYLVTGTIPPHAVDVADTGLPELPPHLSSSVRMAIKSAMTDKRKNRPHSVAAFVALLNGSANNPISDDDGDDEITHIDIAVNVATPKPKQADKGADKPKQADKGADKPRQADKGADKPKQADKGAERHRQPAAQKPKSKRAKAGRWWLWMIVATIVSGAVTFLVLNNSMQTSKSGGSIQHDGATGGNAPSLSLDEYEVVIPLEADSYEFLFDVDSPKRSVQVDVAEDDKDWITIVKCEENKVYYSVTANTLPYNRYGVITLSCDGTMCASYTVTQLSKGEDFTVSIAGVEFRMIWVEGGTFKMGDPEDSDSSDAMQHDVTLSGYWIAQTEVTQELWRAVMGTTVESIVHDGRGGDTEVNGVGRDYPMYNVGYDDAINFCKELNAMTGHKYNFQLPTEAQWEYAARGRQDDDYEYSGSRRVSRVARYMANSNGGANSVMSLAPNSLGIYDMSGNVWEWCYDWYGDYSSSAQTNPTGPRDGKVRVIRGGAWNNEASACRVTYRNNTDPSDRYSTLGFRVVATTCL